MGVVERAEICGLHREVVEAWKEIAGQASALGLADRIVIGVALQARAETLAAYEGLVRDAGDLVGDARAFAAVMRTRNPLVGVAMGVGIASGLLGFLGAWAMEALGPAEVGGSQTALPMKAAIPQTTAALIIVLMIAAGAVIAAVVRATVVAGQVGLSAVGRAWDAKHPAAVLLREVRPVEERLFAVFQRRVPEAAIHAGPLIAVGVGGLMAGVVLAALATGWM